MTILVVGAGIAGSTLALALRRSGLDVVLLEARRTVSETAGAFLALAPNGVNALRGLGLGEVPTVAGGFELHGMDFHDARGRRIAGLAGEDDLHRYGARTVLLRRGRLGAELAARAAAAGVPVLLDARLTGLQQRPGGVRATLADGRVIDAAAVVGADGIWSSVRRLTWPGAPAPSWTGIVDCGGWARVDLPDTARQQMHFGHRAFFGYTVEDSQAYWFSNVPRRDEPARAELDDLDPDVWIATVRQLHDRDPAPVRAVLEAADGSLGAWPVYDLPDLAEWHRERVCLVGDAAHAVSPSSGQGASLAIEDAAVLAQWLRREPDPRLAFAGFVGQRRARAVKIVRFGRQMGDRKATSGAGAGLRNLLLPVFLRLGARATREHYGYQVPALS